MTYFKYIAYCAIALWACCTGCSSSGQINRSAKKILLNNPAIASGHIGICIYEPATKKYWYNYNADKNFIPASNTKLFTLYAGMKYLGDSLAGLRYQRISDTAINIFATGDPTFLHKDFKQQPVLDFLLHEKSKMYLAASHKNDIPAWGNGWAWNDYNDDYMAERNAFPVYGNTVQVQYQSLTEQDNHADIKWNTVPALFNFQLDSVYRLSPTIMAQGLTDSSKRAQLHAFEVVRLIESPSLKIIPAASAFVPERIPFYTNGSQTTIDILKHDFGVNIQNGTGFDNLPGNIIQEKLKVYTIRSQPGDSIFKPMMHSSDNFFAEQTLLMVSNEKLGYMNDAAIIDTLLKTDLKDIPQQPRWVDGCGLSRYNLFTPQSMVYILDKLKHEFGMNRLENILTTGGMGTLSSYYKKDSGYIFAKTGTLTNNCALSGFLITRSGKLLEFSILANNYTAAATPVRRAVERFLEELLLNN